LFLLEEGPARNREIAEEVGVSPPSVSWHVSRLTDEGVVTEVSEGRTTLYAVDDEELTMGLLVRYQESFVDRAVDRVIDFWG
jgi:DNA-binding transcriptional ArsR family regulator